MPRLLEKLPVVLLSIFCVAIALIAQPPILGWWEGSTVFHTFAPEEIWLNTQIHPRANLGGYEYASLDLSRYVASLFGFNLFSIRLLPIIYGLISLLLMYRVLIRWHGGQIAILVTALLATNQLFLTFQHQLISAIVTFTCVLFVIDRLQPVDSSSVTGRSAFSFGLACAFTALHYQIGRYLMLATVLFWLTRGIGFGEHFRPAFDQLWILDRKKWKHLLFAALGFIITLEVLHLRNLEYFFSKSFLSPQYAEHARGLTEALNNVKVNLPLIIHSLVGTSSYYGDHSSDLLIDVPYQLLNPPLLILALIGLVALILGATNKRHSAFVFLLLFLTTMPLTLSSIMGSGLSTLNSYRMFYALIPLYFLIATGLDWVFKLAKQNGVAGKLAITTLLALIGFQTLQYINETNRFQNYLSQCNCEFQPDPSRQQVRKYVCHLIPAPPDFWSSYSDTSQLQTPRAHHFNFYERDILPYWSYAGRLSKKIKQLSLPGNTALIIDAPITDFESEPFQTHYSGYNFHQIFLAFYLAEHNNDVNYFVPYRGEGPVSPLTSAQNILWARILKVNREFPLLLDHHSGQYVYQGSRPLPTLTRIRNALWNEQSPRIVSRIFRKVARILKLNRGFPLPLDDQSDKVLYIDSKPYYFIVRSTSSFSDSRIYLVTTEEEKSQAIKQIQEIGAEYIIVKL